MLATELDDKGEDADYDEYYRETITGKRLVKRLVFAAALLLTLGISVYKTFQSSSVSHTFSPPLYEDATNLRVTSGAVYILFFPTAIHDSETHASVAYTTKASPDQIIEFYKGKMKELDYYWNGFCSTMRGDGSTVFLSRRSGPMNDNEHRGDVILTTSSNWDGTLSVNIRRTRLTTISCDFS